MAPSANTLRGKFLAAEAGRKDVENWDDDFGDEIEDITLRVSMSSAGGAGGSEGPFFQRKMSSQESTGMSSEPVFPPDKPQHAQVFGLAEIGEKDLDAEFDDDYEISTMKLQSAAAGVNRNRAPSDYGTVRQRSSKALKTLEAFGEADDNDGGDDEDWGEFTVKARSSPQKKTGESSLISGALFDDPPVKRRPGGGPMIVEEDFDDDFDLAAVDDLAAKLNHVNLANAAAIGDELDDMAAIRTSSRLSTASSYSTSTYEESDTGGDGNDFFSGFDEMLKNQTAIDLQNRLKMRQRELEDLARREQELLASGKKYDTVRSSGSVNSVKFAEQVADEDEEDLLDGFDVGDNVDEAFAHTVNRNIIVRQRNSRPRSPSKRSDKKPPLQTSASAKNLRRVASRPLDSSSSTSNAPTPALRIKQSMPVLRPQQSMAPSAPSNQISMQKLRRTTPRQHIPPSQSTSAISGRVSGDHTIDLGSGSSSSSFSPTKKSGSGGRLRNVQSMANMQQPSAARQHPTSPQKGRLRTKYVYGDGSELDLLDDLTINPAKERMYTVSARKGPSHRPSHDTIVSRPLDTYVERSTVRSPPKSGTSTVRAPTKSSLSKQNKATSGKKRHSRARGPGLIQNLGHHAMPQIQGEMHFNPKKLIWEGNDIELKKFDSVTPKTRGLISFISNKGVEVSGDMVFDPQRRCWISMVEEDGNDPFEGIDDLEVSVSSSSTRTSGGASASARSGSSNSAAGEFVVGDEFRLSNEFLKVLQEEDERWQRKTKGWFPPNEPFDREYLYEIRNMVVKRGS